MSTIETGWALGHLDESRRLLERSTLSIESIATRRGFGNVVTFRQRLVAAYGTNSTSYRRKFAMSP